MHIFSQLPFYNLLYCDLYVFSLTKERLHPVEWTHLPFNLVRTNALICNYFKNLVNPLADCKAWHTSAVQELCHVPIGQEEEIMDFNSACKFTFKSGNAKGLRFSSVRRKFVSEFLETSLAIVITLYSIDFQCNEVPAEPTIQQVIFMQN